MDTRIADYFCERYPHMPVMFVGTMEECDFYQKRYESNKFEYLIRPTTLGMLLQKCEIMLNMAESDETDASLENKEEYKEETVQEKKRILAVDDSGIFLRSIKNMLESKYDVIVANSGEIAISQAKAKIPDLILLDYEMPGWDGKKTFEEIRKDEALKDIPVIFVTAVSDKMHIMAVLELKPSGYLLKPIEQQRLFETLEEALIEI